MLQLTQSRSTSMPISGTARRALWGLTILDVWAIAWMTAAGDGLDHASPLTAVMTLGGHHQLVFWLSAGGLAALLATAARTGGFTSAGPTARGVLAVAGGASAIAVGGMVSLVALVAGGVALVALLGWAVLR